MVAALTIYVALFGLMLLSGRARLGFGIGRRMLALGFVLAFATSWAVYGPLVWQLAARAPDAAASGAFVDEQVFQIAVRCAHPCSLVGDAEGETLYLAVDLRHAHEDRRRRIEDPAPGRIGDVGCDGDAVKGQITIP